MSEAAANSAQPLTDEQLAEAFPGQDLNHIKSMMGKMDGSAEESSEASTEETADEVVYPDYIPEKFRSGSLEEAHAKLAESYKNLESKLGANSTENSADTGAKEGSEQTEAKALSFADVAAEYQQNGEISEETYKAFEAKGMARDTLDGYIAGQKAIANQLVTKVHTEVGGAEQYEAMVKWADSNWTEAEVKAFDEIVGGSNEAAIMVAVRGLKASFQAAEGVSPNLVEGNAGTPSTGAYQSRSEMTADMKNPKYKTDPAFRKMVEQKIAKSDIW